MTHACQWTHVLGENLILTMAHVEAEDALRGPPDFSACGPWANLPLLLLVFGPTTAHSKKVSPVTWTCSPNLSAGQSLRSPNRSCPDKMLGAPMTNLEGRQLVRFLLVFPPLSLAAFCAFHFLGFCSFLVGCKKTTESLAIPRVGQFCFQLSPCSKPVPPIRWLFLRDEFPR